MSVYLLYGARRSECKLHGILGVDVQLNRLLQLKSPSILLKVDGLFQGAFSYHEINLKTIRHILVSERI